MQKRYNERNATHYELMPKELIDMCLECKRVRCTGNCQQYEKHEREYNKNSSMVRNNGSYIKRGLAAERYPFRGEMITASEMADKLGKHPSTIRRCLNKGMTMEEIFRLYDYELG